MRQFWERPAPLGAALGLAGLGVALAFGVKYQCIRHGWIDGFQYTNLCYNDIQALYGRRGIQDGLMPYRDAAFEYPVLTGMFMDLAGRVYRGLIGAGLVHDTADAGYFVVSSALLAPFAVGVSLILRPRIPAGRLALWAVGVPTILYTFHNWDVLAVLGAVWGVAAYESRRDKQAGAALAAGASAKLFPAFLAPGMVLGRWAENDRRGALRLVLGFALMYLAVNLPWIVVSGGTPAVAPQEVPGVQLREPGTNGWLGVWLFHADRYPDFGTVWYWLGERATGLRDRSWGADSYRSWVSLASFITFAGVTAALLAKGWRRRREPQGLPVVAVGFGVVVGFMLTSKVYSPQFSLWATALMVLLNLRYRYVAAYFVAELVVLVTKFRWFTELDNPDSAWALALEAAVWSRAAVLVVLLWQSTGAVRALPGLAAGEVAGEQVSSN